MAGHPVLKSEFLHPQPHPGYPFVDLTSNCNCLGLIPWVWMLLLQMRFPARQILVRVPSTLQALRAAKLNLAFQIFFFFYFPILTEEIKKHRAEGLGSLQSEPALAPGQETRRPDLRGPWAGQ